MDSLPLLFSEQNLLYRILTVLVRILFLISIEKQCTIFSVIFTDYSFSIERLICEVYTEHANPRIASYNLQEHRNNYSLANILDKTI